MKVVIFGSGPSGLLAAHAATRAGISVSEIIILSDKAKSALYGCQYLHEPIPGISDRPDAPDPRKVAYRLIGSPATYRRKVYGGAYTGNVSVVDLEEEHMAWDVRYCYDKLYEKFRDCHFEMVVGPEFVKGSLFKSMQVQSRFIFSTIPRMAWCDGRHSFEQQKIYAAGDAPEIGIKSPIQHDEESSIICNGEKDVGWYRLARVFGRTTVEWPGWRKPPFEGVVPVVKPLFTNCDCLEGRVHFLGRFGEWKKGVLLHDVFRKAEEIIHSNDSPQYTLF